ncbi:MAG TPA: dienelactone hydrolase family protein [Stellaceae bacterium]|nr:dienelactone hydrolase family protein [Stellaceae bacterium]
MAGQTVTIAAADGGTFAGYLAVPSSGSGPGIVLLQEIFGVNANMRAVADYYAEEGYVVLAPDLFWRLEPGVELGFGDADMQKAFALYQKFDFTKASDDITASVKALRALPQCQGKVGALGFCLGGLLALLAASRSGVDCAVGYYGVGIEGHLDEAAAITVPLALHFGTTDNHVSPEALAAIQARLSGLPNVEIHVYPAVGHGFAAQGRDAFDKPATMMAHSRSIAVFRKVMGPHYDLSALWDKHCEYEFGLRDVGKTMATMVAEPYVNHIPTMTGGVGYRELYRFYKHHFVDSNPADTKLVPISRTIGADRVVDEMLFCFTHDREIDWILPGVKPTGKYVETPVLAVICFRGDKLYNEHIYWDQASVLVQIGLLDPKLYPVVGHEAVAKLLDPSLPSNTLNPRWGDSAKADVAAQ